jgi:general secretion pathway protein F
MATYRFEAVNAQGQTIKGEMEAASSDAVIDHLQRLGHVPLLAHEKSKASWLQALQTKASVKIAPRDVLFFTEELATLLQAGLPLERALGLLGSLTDRKNLKAFIDAVLTEVRSGAPLSKALAAQKDMLPGTYIGMVQAGEAGGGAMMDQTLERLAGYLSRMQQTRDAVASALLYPAILVVVAIIAIALMLVFVIPQFEPLFESAGADLPLSTQLLLFVSKALRDYGLVLLVLLAGGMYYARRLLSQPANRQQVDAFMLRLPRIGNVLVKAETAKFCRTLGALQAGGLSLAVALPIAEQSLDNRSLAAAAARTTARVREGHLLSSALEPEPLFPVLMKQMVRIGEETGRLDALLARAGDIHDRDVRRSLARMMTLLAPALTILIGIVIAGIIAAVLSAILSVNDLAG